MNNEKDNLLPSKKQPTLRDSISFKQLMSVIIIILPNIPSGMALAFSAIALPELNLNLEESSLIASLPAVGSVLGNLLTGFIIDRYGRKNAFFINIVPSFIGFAFLSAANSFKIFYLYIGQICTGISQGAAIYVATLYIAESIAPDNLHFRSSLMSSHLLCSVFGINLTYCLGYLFHYRVVASIAASIALISSILLLVFIPESPAWLDQRGKFKDAQQARYKLGCTLIDVESLTSKPRIGVKTYIPDNFFSYLSKIKRKNVYKPLLITIAYFIFEQFSGTRVYVAYLVNIIAVKSVSINSYLTTLICGLIMILSQISFTTLLPKTGLRKIAITSALLASSATLVLGICVYLGDTVAVHSYIIDYIHIFSVWCNVYFGGLGVAVIPYLILSEIFPADAKGFASVSIFADNIFLFINLVTYPRAKELSTYVIYYVYAIIGFISVPFVYYCIPETVGRTLEQLSSDFSS